MDPSTPPITSSPPMDSRCIWRGCPCKGTGRLVMIPKGKNQGKRGHILAPCTTAHVQSFSAGTSQWHNVQQCKLCNLKLQELKNDNVAVLGGSLMPFSPSIGPRQASSGSTPDSKRFQPAADAPETPTELSPEHQVPEPWSIAATTMMGQTTTTSSPRAGDDEVESIIFTFGNVPKDLESQLPLSERWPSLREFEATETWADPDFDNALGFKPSVSRLDCLIWIVHGLLQPHPNSWPRDLPSEFHAVLENRCGEIESANEPAMCPLEEKMRFLEIKLKRLTGLRNLLEAVAAASLHTPEWSPHTSLGDFKIARFPGNAGFAFALPSSSVNLGGVDSSQPGDIELRDEDDKHKTLIISVYDRETMLDRVELWQTSLNQVKTKVHDWRINFLLDNNYTEDMFSSPSPIKQDNPWEWSFCAVKPLSKKPDVPKPDNESWKAFPEQQQVGSELKKRIEGYLNLKSKKLDDFTSFKALIIVPRFNSLRLQTFDRTLEAGLGDAARVIMYSNAAADKGCFDNLLSAAEADPKLFLVCIFDEAHWGPVGAHKKMAMDKRVMTLPNVVSIMVTATPANLLTQRSRIHPANVVAFDPKTSSYRSIDYYISTMEEVGRELEKCQRRVVHDDGFSTLLDLFIDVYGERGRVSTRSHSGRPICADGLLMAWVYALSLGCMGEFCANTADWYKSGEPTLVTKHRPVTAATTKAFLSQLFEVARTKGDGAVEILRFLLAVGPSSYRISLGEMPALTGKARADKQAVKAKKADNIKEVRGRLKASHDDEAFLTSELVELWISEIVEMLKPDGGKATLATSARMARDLLTLDARTKFGKMAVVRVYDTDETLVLRGILDGVLKKCTSEGPPDRKHMLAVYEDVASSSFSTDLDPWTRKCDLGEPFSGPKSLINRVKSRGNSKGKGKLIYEDLLNLPCVIVLCEKGRMGDTFPHSLAWFDNRLRFAGVHSAFIQEFGRLCRYPALEKVDLWADGAGEGLVKEKLVDGFGIVIWDEAGKQMYKHFDSWPEFKQQIDSSTGQQTGRPVMPIKVYAYKHRLPTLVTHRDSYELLIKACSKKKEGDDKLGRVDALSYMECLPMSLDNYADYDRQAKGPGKRATYWTLFDRIGAEASFPNSLHGEQAWRVHSKPSGQSKDDGMPKDEDAGSQHYDFANTACVQLPNRFLLKAMCQQGKTGAYLSLLKELSQIGPGRKIPTVKLPVFLQRANIVLGGRGLVEYPPRMTSGLDNLRSTKDDGPYCWKVDAADVRPYKTMAELAAALFVAPIQCKSNLVLFFCEHGADAQGHVKSKVEACEPFAVSKYKYELAREHNPLSQLLQEVTPEGYNVIVYVSVQPVDKVARKNMMLSLVQGLKHGNERERERLRAEFQKAAENPRSLEANLVNTVQKWKEVLECDWLVTRATHIQQENWQEKKIRFEDYECIKAVDEAMGVTWPGLKRAESLAWQQYDEQGEMVPHAETHEVVDLVTPPSTQTIERE